MSAKKTAVFGIYQTVNQAERTVDAMEMRVESDLRKKSTDSSHDELSQAATASSLLLSSPAPAFPEAREQILAAHASTFRKSWAMRPALRSRMPIIPTIGMPRIMWKN